ncbi:hypothetical protein [Streptomyces sp. NPDC048277]|uniref:hypothetical protein n=1 Tax=Streptomyces sp. NPDC048277 TaxID=3155027 RepID=UPI0033C4AFCF
MLIAGLRKAARARGRVPAGPAGVFPEGRNPDEMLRFDGPFASYTAGEGGRVGALEGYGGEAEFGVRVDLSVAPAGGVPLRQQSLRGVQEVDRAVFQRLDPDDAGLVAAVVGLFGTDHADPRVRGLVPVGCVDAGKGAGERGAHRQLRQITVGDFERCQDADALAVSPADHTAHRAHCAQQGAGHQAEQQRGYVTRCGERGSGTVPIAFRSEGSFAGVHNSSTSTPSRSAS